MKRVAKNARMIGAGERAGSATLGWSNPHDHLQLFIHTFGPSANLEASVSWNESRGVWEFEIYDHILNFRIYNVSLLKDNRGVRHADALNEGTTELLSWALENVTEGGGHRSNNPKRSAVKRSLM